jgi:hypothetical protein
MPKSKLTPDDPPESLMVFGRAMTDADAANLRSAIGEFDGAQPVSLATAGAFRINPQAKGAVADFLAKCEHSALMTKIVNDLRASVPPWLIDAVHGVDGTPADLAILLGGVPGRGDNC